MKNKRAVVVTGAIIGLLLALGLLVRIYGAWRLETHANSDAGIVALMAKHMAEGLAWPVFFYGQAYMGSLEPVLSAFFCSLLGVSGFAVALGTAVVSFFTLLVVGLWAKDMEGPWAAIAALSVALIGPLGYFHYNVSPRGGYAATLLFGTLTLWLAVKICRDYQKTNTLRHLDFALLGLAAGLGWWSNQLVVAALAASAVLLLIFLRARALSWTTLTGLAGFLAGGAPFWWFNLKHQWPSFSFSNSLGRMSMQEGLALFFTDRLRGVLGVRVPDWLNHVHWALLLVALFFYLYHVAVSKAGRREVLPGHLAIFMFTLFSALIFSISHFASFNTPRYLLPLLPVWAVVYGAGVAAIARFNRWLAMLFVIAPLVIHAGNLKWAAEHQTAEQGMKRAYDAWAGWSKENGLTNYYANYRHHAANFITGETVTIADNRFERYRPYARALEFADRIGMLDNAGDIQGFLERHGGSASTVHQAGLSITHDFKPPRTHLKRIDPVKIASVNDRHGRGASFLMTNSWVDFGWQPREPNEEDWLEIRFVTNEVVSLIRLFALRQPAGPYAWSLNIMETPDGEWKELVHRAPPPAYYWSGERVYPNGRYARFEYTFGDRPIAAIRIISHGGRPDWIWTIQHLGLYAPDDPAGEETRDVHDLHQKLITQGVDRVYADRFLANQLHRISGGTIAIPFEDYLAPPWESHGDYPMVLSASMAMVVEQEDEKETLAVLEEGSFEARIERSGPWSIIRITGMDAEKNPDDFKLSWCGFMPMLQWRGTGIHPRATSVPDDFPLPDEEVRFGDVIQFCGFDQDAYRFYPGGELAMTYYWRWSPKTRPEDYAAFVHFKNAEGTIVGQGDYVLTGQHLPVIMRDDQDRVIHAIQRYVRIPPDVNDEQLTLFMGVYNRVSGKRLEPVSAWTSGRRGVYPPVTLQRAVVPSP